MNRLTERVISFFELVEAEGRELREQAQGDLRGAAMFFFGGIALSGRAHRRLCPLPYACLAAWAPRGGAHRGAAFGSGWSCSYLKVAPVCEGR